MKKRLIYWLAAIPLIFTACVEDEYAEGSRTPIQFTVNMAGDKGITRSNTVNDAWTNGDPVAVQMTSGGSSIVKKYMIDKSESPIKLVPYAGVEPFYWPNSSTTSVTVSAWYPYAATKPTANNTNTSITDQSTADKYEAANLMEAAEVTHTFSEEEAARAFNLTFAHKMAKLIIEPYYNTDINGKNSHLIKADILRTTAYVNLCKNGSDPVEIIAHTYTNENEGHEYDCRFEVLVAPQTITSDQYIKLCYLNANTKQSSFKYSLPTNQLLEAGKTYTYNVNFNTAADSAISVTTTLTGATLTYDGSSHNYKEYITISAPVTCNGKTLTAGTDYEIIGDLNETDAGTYTVTVRGKGQYSNNNTSSFTWTINKKDGTLTIPTARGGVAPINMFDTINGGSFKDGEVPAGTIYYGLSTGAVPIVWYQTRDESIDSPQLITAAGNYKIWYKVVPDDNYKISDSDITNYVDANGISKTPLSFSITGSSE